MLVDLLVLKLVDLLVQYLVVFRHINQLETIPWCVTIRHVLTDAHCSRYSVSISSYSFILPFSRQLFVTIPCDVSVPNYYLFEFSTAEVLGRQT